MRKKKVAVILAGAVAKGAYEAGALEVLARQGLEVTRIVAASSGALNGALYASYVRRGIEEQGAAELADMWTRSASVWKIFSPAPSALVRAKGISSLKKVRGLLESRLEPGPVAAPRPISLRILVSTLGGIDSARLDALAQEDDPDELPPKKNRTTHELVCDFTEQDLATREGTARVVTAALASSAFPGAFVSVPICDPQLGEVGPCIDGGAANNTPIKWALGGAIGDELDAIILISPTIELETEPLGDLGGASLIDRVGMLLVNERLYRDLREADQVNRQLDRLRALHPGTLDDKQYAAVLEALGWTKMRKIQIVSIRPKAGLAGNSFAAFAWGPLRKAYLRRGQEDAEAAFADPAHRWLVTPGAPSPPR